MRTCIVFVALVACGGGSRPDGEEGGDCRPDRTCDPGLVCNEDDRCVGSDGGVVIVDAGGPVFDASFACADDSPLEPNDTVATAFATPVASVQRTITIAGMAICPSGDQDHFGVSLPSTMSLSAAVTFAELEPLQVTILNAGGTPLVNGSAIGPRTVSALAPNLPAGNYVVRVVAGVGGINNYSLSIDATP